jgi:hypothetical protein
MNDAGRVVQERNRLLKKWTITSQKDKKDEDKPSCQARLASGLFLLARGAIPCEAQGTRPPCLDPIDDKSIPDTDANQFSIPRIALRMNIRAWACLVVSRSFNCRQKCWRGVAWGCLRRTPP